MSKVIHNTEKLPQTSNGDHVLRWTVFLVNQSNNVLGFLCKDTSRAGLLVLKKHMTGLRKTLMQLFPSNGKGHLVRD